MPDRVLDVQEAAVLRQEQQALHALRGVLRRVQGTETDAAFAEALQTLDQTIQQLDELFLLVVVGEFNAGKSALINALLGQRYLEEGVTPTTAQIHLLRYGDSAATQPTRNGSVTVYYPAEWLREINLVDTPGANAVLRHHQVITDSFIPRSDLVLFVTSADRPFSESERQFLEGIRNWGKKVVIIVNKADILEGDEARAKVLAFVREHARRLLGVEPSIFLLSARQALQAKTAAAGNERERLWQASQFGPLEDYIFATLDQRARIKLKLSSPLGVAVRLADFALDVAAKRLHLLQDDLRTLDSIETALADHKAEMQRDFEGHLARVDRILLEMLQRGTAYFEETIRLTRIFDLLNAERVRGEFERQVVRDTPAQIEKEVSQIIDWLVERDYRQWQHVNDSLDRRRLAEYEEQGRLVGKVAGAFDYNRQRLLESVGRETERVIASYDRAGEAKALAESVKMAVTQAAILEVGAVGLGAVLTKVLVTAMADVSGLLAAGVVATAGLYVLPAKRKRATNDLRKQVEQLRQLLRETLLRAFEQELDDAMQRMRDGIKPYARFVQREEQELTAVQQELTAMQAEWRALEEAIARL